MPDPTDSARLLTDATRVIGQRDAEILLAAAWNLSRAQLLARAGDPVPATVAQRFAEHCARRAAGTPVAYLLGQREFWSLPFEVSPAVLVPRPETELLVERVLELVHEPAARVADLGTGSGAIAISLSHERPGWRIVGTDVSSGALAVARRNGERLAEGRVEWLGGEWFAPLAGRRFHALVSNPPYIDAHDAALQDDGVRFEPRLALTPGDDGLAAIHTLINGAPKHLEPGGWIALEHGAAQGAAVRAALVARGFAHVTSHRDLAGRERVTEGQIPHARF